jgi:RNA polymerase sigma factor (sigma-70 family)
MAGTDLSGFLCQLTRAMAAETLAGQSDRELVTRYLAEGREAFFAALVSRHGPMVYRVCWRVLQHPQDCEDAFQATFLILAQNLRTLRKQTALASWLHGVARRVALKARARAATRRRHESQAPAAQAAPPGEVCWAELRSALDAALARMADRWRLPLILCYLEGRTQDEAAAQLGWSKNTLRRRLEEARTALGRRLSRRGFWPAALTAVLASDCAASALPPNLLTAAVEAAACSTTGQAARTAAVAARVTSLTQGALRAMLMSKLKLAAAALALLIALAVGASGPLSHTQATQPPGGRPRSESATVPPGASAARPRGKPKADAKPQMPTWTLRHTMRHDAIINGVAFGKESCASWGEDGAIRLWDPKTGRAGPRLRPHPDKEPVRFAYFLPDAKHLFAISGNGALTVWEFGKQPSHGKVFTITNVVLGLGRDHQSLAVVLQDAVVISRFKLPEFGFVPGPRDFVAGAVNAKPVCTSFTVDGNLLAVGFDNGLVGLWDTTNNRECWSHTHHTGEVRALALSPDDKFLATAGKDGAILLWDVAQGTVTAKLKGHEGEVRAVAFSHDGKLLVSGGEDKTARVWDLPARRESVILRGHVGAVTAVAIDAQGASIMTGSAEGSARVWQLQKK